jgi:hypothetical protein
MSVFTSHRFSGLPVTVSLAAFMAFHLRIQPSERGGDLYVTRVTLYVDQTSACFLLKLVLGVGVTGGIGPNLFLPFVLSFCGLAEKKTG